MAMTTSRFAHCTDYKVIVILSKVAKAFCAGADIKEFLNNSYEKELTHWSFGELATTLGSLRKILISGVNGLALGGGLELALYSDILICSEEA
jgi:enoyl-CoA hydratase/carnithine racemase